MTFKRFPYRAYAGRHSPSLEVDLVGVNGRELRQLALIDTGAEYSCMPLELGRQLGVDESLCVPLMTNVGIGQEPVQESLWWNESPAGASRESPVVHVMGHEVPIAPMLRESMDIVALGRHDFLAAFKFCCDERARSFSLELYDEPVTAWRARTEN